MNPAADRRWGVAASRFVASRFAASRLAGMAARVTLLGMGLLLACLAAAPDAAAQAAAPAPDTDVRLRIYALGSQTLLYQGRRTVQHAGGRATVRTVYERADGTPIQRTEGVYEEATLLPVSFHLEDLRSGEEETLTREGGAVHMSYRATGKDAPSNGSLDTAPLQIFSSTVVPFLLRQWEPLIGGQEVDFRLLVPSRRDSYAFHLIRDSSAAAAGRITVRMEPDTWLVRQLVDPLFFLLDEAPPHRLREFRGRSSIKSDDGKDQDLRTVYSYPGSE